MTKRVNCGGVAIGGGARVSIQSMTNTDTRDVEATAAQIRCLAAAGATLCASLSMTKHAPRPCGRSWSKALCRLSRTSTSTTRSRSKRWKTA